MSLKKILPVILILCANASLAQKNIYSANFESNQLDQAWQIVTGNWYIGNVEQLRIAPAENGYQYMLCSGGKNHIGDNIIQLSVDIPDSIKALTIKLSFSYYIFANAPGTRVEGEFYQKEMKDGLRGKVWTADLHRIKGRWTTFQKTLKIPAEANTVRIVIYGLESSGKTDRIVCFDNVIISALK